MGNDIFMGGIKFTPDFDNLSPDNEWHTLAGGPGKIQIGVAFAPSTVCPSLILSPYLLRLSYYIANPDHCVS